MNNHTDPPFNNEYFDHFEDGSYRCKKCGQVLFSSKTKYDSGSGWPSFYDIEKDGAVKFSDDYSHNMHRIEVSCSKCGSHLGHMFPDDTPTGKYYCINSSALDFKKPDSDV